MRNSGALGCWNPLPLRPAFATCVFLLRLRQQFDFPSLRDLGAQFLAESSFRQLLGEGLMLLPRHMRTLLLGLGPDSRQAPGTLDVRQPGPSVLDLPLDTCFLGFPRLAFGGPAFDFHLGESLGRFPLPEYLKRGGTRLEVFLHRTDQQRDRILDRGVTLNLEEFDFAEMGDLLRCGAGGLVAATADDLGGRGGSDRNKVCNCRRDERCPMRSLLQTYSRPAAALLSLRSRRRSRRRS